MAAVSHNGNIRHCARSALRPVGIPPSHGRHSALRRQFSLVGIPPVGIRASTLTVNSAHESPHTRKHGDTIYPSSSVPIMHSPQSWVMSYMADVHEVQEANDKFKFHRQMGCEIKNRTNVSKLTSESLGCPSTGRMSLNWRQSRWDAHQSRLEGLDGRGHNDISRQLTPNLNNSRKETVGKGIDTPSWNTKLTTVSSRILSVWSQIQWCRYCDQSNDYSVHHHSSGLISAYFQCIPTQLLHHKSWTSFAAKRTSRLTVS